MDDYIKLLKNEMKLLEDKDKGQELRQDLKIGNLDKKELLKYEIDFLAKNLGHKNLNCMDNIRKKFKEGMRTLSKSREEKFKGILLGKQERCLKEQERPQFFGTYSKIDKAYLEENRVFSVQEIGKSTINVPTENKDKARSRVQREQQKLVEANREQFE